MAIDHLAAASPLQDLFSRVKELIDAVNALSGGGISVSWDDVSDKPATYPPTIGTSATTASAGNHNHAVTADAGSGLAAAANIQALAVALSTRIKALEDA